MDAQRKARVEMLSKCDFSVLRQTRSDAAAAGNLSLADDAHQAIRLRARSQNAEIERSGEIFEHIQPPSRENGGRFITTFTGDPMVWFKHFARPGAVCKVRGDLIADMHRAEAALRDAQENGAPVMVRVRAGQRAAVIDAQGNIVSAG